MVGPKPNGAGRGRPGGAPWQVRSDSLHGSEQERYDKKMTRFNPVQGKNASIQGGGGFNKGAAGGKSYGMGRPGPNMGKTTNKAGYGKRDVQNARIRAIQKQLGGM